jgi:hypothetical protein
MSLDISKLENVRKRSGKVIARCPACAEPGHDQKGEHLVINADGRFGCVVYPGDSGDAKEHRKRIFALCGDREIKPLAVRPAEIGRLGRPTETHLAATPIKTGLLGRLGRVFQTHLEGHQQSSGDKKPPADHQLNDCRKGVLSVLNHSSTLPDHPLAKNERELLIRWCGTDYDPIVLVARTLFNATIVGIERNERRTASTIKACQTEFSW